MAAKRQSPQLTVLTGAGLTLAEAVERYLDAQESRGAAVNTLKSYAHDLHHFAQVVPADLATVDVGAIRAFLHDDGRLSPATRQRRFATLSSFYRWLYRHDLVPVNLMDRVDRIDVPRREPRPLSPDVVAAVLKAIPSTATRDRALFTLLYETGMRIGEALGVTVADLDLTQDDEQIRVIGKGNRERTVLLTAARESIRLLRRHLKVSGITSGAVFRGDARFGGSNEPLGYTTARRAWQHYCATASVVATIHQLRHSRASQLVQAAVPLMTVRKVLGHRNIQSTMIYAETDAATVKRDLLEYQRRVRG